MKYLKLGYDGFDWDDGNSLKIQNRVSIQEVENFFAQKLLLKEDTRHSFSEERFIAMGYGTDRKVLFVAFTIRNKGVERLIRVISARYTHKKEREAYEKIKQALQKERDEGN